MITKNGILKFVISSDINDQLFTLIVEDIENHPEINEIEFLINSSGGDLNTMLGLYDYLKLSKLNIITKVFGQASSAALLLFLLGKKREISKNSVILLHEPFVLEKDDETLSESEKNEINRISEIYYDIISKETNISKENIKKYAKNNTFMFSDFLKQNNFIN